MSTQPAKSVSLTYDEVRDAFEYTSAGRPHENNVYIDSNTGKIYYDSDYIAPGEESPEDLEESDVYIAVPHKNDLDLGRDLVFAFASEALPDQWDKIRDIFRSRGAYARFKDLLEAKGQLEAWYAFEESATERALRAWCEDVGIQLDDAPPSTSTD
jgi:hypothetical protein